jgi:hypothetical protein
VPYQRVAGDRRPAWVESVGERAFLMSAPLARLGVRMDRITLTVPPEPAFHGTLRLVVGGIGARSQLSYEQVSELQLAVESLVAHRRVQGDAIIVEADLDSGGISLLLGPFEPEDDPSRLRVVERLVARVAVVERDRGQWLELVSEGPRT